MDVVNLEPQDLLDNHPNTVCEVICVKCLARSVNVRPSNVFLKDIECESCKSRGYIIMTGQNYD